MCKGWSNCDEIRIYVTTSQTEGEGQLNKWKKYGKYIKTYLIGNTGRPDGIDNTKTILWESNMIKLSHFLHQLVYLINITLAYAYMAWLVQ